MSEGLASTCGGQSFGFSPAELGKIVYASGDKRSTRVKITVVH